MASTTGLILFELKEKMFTLETKTQYFLLVNRGDIYLVCKDGVHLFGHSTTIDITQRSKAKLL